MSRIFISHSSANNAEAMVLSHWLAAHGWDDLFLDIDPERGLKPGERWQTELKRAADRCELVIILISPAWASSKWSLTEFLVAKALNKRIFAVTVEPTAFADLPAELTAEWQIADLAGGARDYEKAVILPPGDRPATVRFSGDGLNRLRIGLMQTGLDPKYFPWPPAHDPDRPAYRGLLPLEAEDAGIFFGRSGAILNGMEALRGLATVLGPRLLVILGASGSGKSSFMRAGLLPRLERDEHFFPLPVVRPERDIINGNSGLVASLEGALKRVHHSTTRAQIRQAVQEGASGVVPLLEPLSKATAEAGKPRVLILPIDQAEELFLAGGGEAEFFLRLIRDLAARETPALIALFTIRSDNYERLQSAVALEGIRQHTLSLAPVPHGSYREIIVGPAQKLEGSGRALTIEEPLVDALLDDIEAGGAKDALPLLAFTMELLYREYGAAGRLTLASYRDLGGIKGSIEIAVERALRAGDGNPKIPQDRQARLALLRRGLIPWLAGIDLETGLPRRSVARLSEIPEEARPLIDLFVDQRLLSIDKPSGAGEATIEPAHEALLRQWGQLRSWLGEDRALLSLLDGVKRASRDWAANNRDPSWLTHTKQRLQDAETLLGDGRDARHQMRPDFASSFERTDKDYLKACRELEAARSRKARSIQALVGFLLFLLVSGGVGWLNRKAIYDYYYWRYQMGASALPGEKEMKLAPLEVFQDCRNGCPDMVVIPAGTFMMGSDEGGNSEFLATPRHPVEFKRPFAISKTEVTFKQWQLCVDSGACNNIMDDSGWGRGDRPVINVEWEECRQYAAWLSRLSRKKYRLPSEAEWEYAARAGTKTRFFFGDDESALDQYAWFKSNSDGMTHPAGMKKPNAFGLLDIYGNVREWVADYAHKTYDGAPGDGTAWGETSDVDKSRRIVRGRSWDSGPEELGSANRDGGTLRKGYKIVGFRLARDLDR